MSVHRCRLGGWAAPSSQGGWFPAMTHASVSVLDSILFRDAFGTPAMREIFSDHGLISRYIEVEVALARAEAPLRRDPGGGGRGDRRALAAWTRSTSTSCGTRPRSSATRSCRSCTSWRRCAAKPGATCTGARRRRTSWTRPSCCRSATRSTLIEADISRPARHPGRPRASATATRRWPAAPTCSRRCRSRSATRWRSGSRCSTAMRSGWRSCARGCWSGSSPAPPARSPRSATAGSTCSRR